MDNSCNGCHYNLFNSVSFSATKIIQFNNNDMDYISNSKQKRNMKDDRWWEAMKAFQGCLGFILWVCALAGIAIAIYLLCKK